MDRTETLIFDIKNNYENIKNYKYTPEVEYQLLVYQTIKSSVFKHNYQVDAYLLDEIIELCDDYLNERITND